MNSLTRLSRILAPLFSLSLLAGYVVYSHQSVNLSKGHVEWSDDSSDSFARLLVDDDLLTAALSPNDLRHQLQPIMSDRLMKDALPREDSSTAGMPHLNVTMPVGSLFELDSAMMEARKSETLSLLFPLRLSQEFRRVPTPDERTWIRSEQPNPSPKGLMDQLADPVAMRTILTDDGTAVAKSGRLARPDESWKQGQTDEPGLQKSVTVTDYPESWTSTPMGFIVPERSVMMASSKSGAVRFVFDFPSPKPSIFPVPVVKDPKGMDPKVVETIMHDNGTALAKSGRLLTPEKLWYRLERHSTLMSSSKSGPVFQQPLFDFTQPLLKSDMPIKP